MTARKGAGRPRRTRPSLVRLALVCLAACACVSAPIGAAWSDEHPSPAAILGSRVLRTPPIDAIPICIPSRIDESLRRRARERASWPDSAAELAAALRSNPDAASDDEMLVGALLLARAAKDATALASAADGLAPWRSSTAGPEAQACARLETARAQLLLRRLPEAVAHARLAQRLRRRVPAGGEIQEASEFYIAEALYLSGRVGAARSAHRRLSGSASPRVAAAARLRFADALFDTGNKKGARLEYADLLPRAGEFGASLTGWGLRAIEATLDDGDVEAAGRWAEDLLAAGPAERVDGATRIHLADILGARGEVAAARRILDRLMENRESPEIALLAELRLADHDPEAATPERVTRYREIIRTSSRPFADYARLLLARDQVALGDFGDAIDALARVAFGPVADRLSGSLRTAIDSALGAMSEAASDPSGCADLVSVVGWRRGLLARRSGDPDPFAHLGECYAMLGLEHVAIEVFKEVTRRFGKDGDARVALPLARAFLSRGDVEAARRAAIAHGSDSGPDRDGWQLLHAEVEMFEGRYGGASETLKDLVARDRPSADRARAIVLLARAASHLAIVPELRHDLGDAIQRLSEDQRAARGDWVGEAALLAAEGHRSAGDLPSARSLYRIAVEVLPAGERRDQAHYWLAELGAPTASASPEGGAGGWRRLAEARRRIEGLQARLDRPVTAEEQP